MSRKKIWLVTTATSALAAAGLLAFFLAPLPAPSPIDDCKYETSRVIGKHEDSEVRLAQISCGLEVPYYRVSAHSPKLSEAKAEENALEIDEESTCEDFADSLYMQGNLLIGCCPEPASAGSPEQRELVFVTRVDPKTGVFDPVDHPSFINVVRTYDEKAGKYILSPSCAERTLEVDYDHLPE